MTFWRNWDDHQKATALRITGLCVAALALWALIASVSYLFTWRQDQSLLGMPEEMSPEVTGHNYGGKLGYRLGHLLVCGWFGLGSFALLVIPIAISVRLLAGGWRKRILDTCAASLSGAMICSLILAYAGDVLGADNAFGGGLGGHFGSFVISWGRNLFGDVVTLVFAILLAVCWMLCCGGGFSRMVSRMIERRARRRAERKARKAKAREARLAAKSGSGGEEDGSNVEESTDGGAAPLGGDDFAGDGAAAGGDPGGMLPGEVLMGEDAAGDSGPASGGGSIAGGFALAEDNQSSDPASGDGSSGINGSGAVGSADGNARPADGTASQPGSFTVEEGGGYSTTIKKPLPRFEPRKEELPDYHFPTLDLLGEYSTKQQDVTKDELLRNNNKIRTALSDYGIQLDDVRAIVGPTVTLYKLYPAKGVKIAEIKRVQEDLALKLNAKGVRVVVLEDAVGVEVANDVPSIVPLRAMLNDDAYRNSKAELPIAIGFTIQRKVKVFDLAEAPHLLVAGATRMGKSVGLNTIVSSLLYAKHPSELKFVFIDPKMVEFSSYVELLHHYLAVLPDAVDDRDERNNAIVKKPKDAEKVLRSLCIEMDDRYELLSKAYVNNIKLYNDKFQDRKLLPTEGHRFLPYIVVIIDEYADLTLADGASPEVKAASRSIQNSIVRLAQKGRAAGIHVILATQRPSVNVISGIIKANFPTRIAFRVFSRVDSNTILDTTGAEKLIGNGDMIYYSGVESERIQCAYVSNKEINAITRYIGEQQGWRKSYNTPYYLPDPSEEAGEGGGMVDMKDLDERFEDAARMVVTAQKGSTSDLQRKLSVGYAKAGRIMDQLEAAGIVGPQEGSKPRQVLVHDLNELDGIIKAFKHQQ